MEAARPKVTKKPGDDAQKSPKSQQKVTKKPGDDAQKITQKPPKRPKKVLARPGTRGPSILHESTSKSAIRDPRDIPGRRIAARVDLEGSRGLESLPGALFFRGPMSLFSKKCHFCRKKTAGGRAREPQTRAGSRRRAGGGRRQGQKGRRQASGRPGGRRPPGGQNPGFFKNVPGASGGLRGLPLSPPVPPVPLMGPLGPQKGPKTPRGGSWGPWGPHGPPLRYCAALYCAVVMRCDV